MLEADPKFAILDRVEWRHHIHENGAESHRGWVLPPVTHTGRAPFQAGTYGETRRILAHIARYVAATP